MAGNLARGSLPHAPGVSVTQSVVMGAANTPVDKKKGWETQHGDETKEIQHASEEICQ